ncbi:hypothetical protein A1O1_08742 [Capronia coronata CBS 617.96]|uniref:Phosphatidylethanolamine-binding protein n=1 Tax=Capronia coronata CBS 617.96 TaxID=1182541 RepID=W9XGY5_9EURO|nr:uncharacterized protein A1O1_08742 [Capronia coronata CBS 617.96]EXJ79478.1 hypothetical protein A1O1_08742 [Capronia coronata CBS 617.96]
MTWTIAFSLLVALPLAVAIPPPDFGFPEAPNHTELSVTYQANGNSFVVAEADLFGVDIPAKEPTVAVETASYESIATYNGSYVLLMVDPDARYPSSPNLRFILHWLQTDMTVAAQSPDGTSQLVNSSAPRVPHLGPSPPTDSAAHRYIIYAFFQHANFTFPQNFEDFNATSRTNFNLPSFLDESKLGQTPAAAMYYFASNQTQVPQDFTATAGGTYPGGNGGMITAGPGPNITSSTAPAAPSTSASTTSSSVTSTSASDSGTSASGSASQTASETGSTTRSAASASDTSDAVKLLVGSGGLVAGLISLWNLV